MATDRLRYFAEALRTFRRYAVVSVIGAASGAVATILLRPRRASADERCLVCSSDAEASVHYRWTKVSGGAIAASATRPGHQYIPLGWNVWTPKQRARWLNGDRIRPVLMGYLDSDAAQAFDSVDIGTSGNWRNIQYKDKKKRMKVPTTS